MKKRVKKSFLFKKTQKEAKREKLLHLAEISLILDNYDDIFSDFDPRPYSQRALSYDFLQEIKRASRDKNYGKFSLKFLVPKKRRNEEHEIQIKKRLKEHFRKHHNLLNKEVKTIKRKGFIFTVIGSLMVLASSYIVSKHPSNLIINFLEILLQTSGWFTAWTGLDQIYYTAQDKKEDLVFYEKMSKCKIGFLRY